MFSSVGIISGSPYIAPPVDANINFLISYFLESSSRSRVPIILISASNDGSSTDFLTFIIARHGD